MSRIDAFCFFIDRFQRPGDGKVALYPLHTVKIIKPDLCNGHNPNTGRHDSIKRSWDTSTLDMTEDGYLGLVPNWRSSSLPGAFPPSELLLPALVPVKFRNDYPSDVSMGNSPSDDNNNFFAASYRFMRL